MKEKNKKKQENKKRRNFWPISPITRIKESKKIYKRNKIRKTTDNIKKKYEKLKNFSI